MLSANTPETRFATRLSFLAAGFAIACWAPLVPFAKARLGINDGELGLLILCLGIGSVTAMLLTGIASTRFGSKPVIIAGGLGLALLLPLLTLANTPWTLGFALLLFGACLGSIDVAMNIHAVDVERAASRPLMSGFHALFSVGGFLGASLLTFLLSMKLAPLTSSLLCSAVVVLAVLIAWPRLLRTVHAVEGPLFALPHGVVLLLAALAAITFLVEGAILDWSALLITDARLVTPDQGGLGYMLFAIAMTTGRLCGDAVTSRLGDRRALISGGLVAFAGFAVLLLVPVASLALAGFLMIGLGVSNLVPVLFRQAGAQRIMPAALAVAAITTVGYAGILLGPAVIGFVAKGVGLPLAFGLLALLLIAVPACANRLTPAAKAGV